MDISITGRNIELDEAVRRYAERRLGRMDRYFPGVRRIRVVITDEKTRSPEDRFLVEVAIDTERGLVLAEERGRNIPMAVDKAKDVLKIRLERLKGKLYVRGY